jgi:hypothetical protein
VLEPLELFKYTMLCKEYSGHNNDQIIVQLTSMKEFHFIWDQLSYQNDYRYGKPRSPLRKIIKQRKENDYNDEEIHISVRSYLRFPEQIVQPQHIDGEVENGRGKIIYQAVVPNYMDGQIEKIENHI